jgi:hypothetical protein
LRVDVMEIIAPDEIDLRGLCHSLAEVASGAPADERVVSLDPAIAFSSEADTGLRRPKPASIGDGRFA